MARLQKGRLTLLEKILGEGYLDAYIQGTDKPIWKELRAGVGYSRPDKRGGSRRFGLEYHSDDDVVRGTAEWRFKKGGLARSIDGKAIRGRTNPKYF
tara:strand:- start:99 stop:389 length:291 start_codon:yes stop_codon:yes gene_type:complete